MSLTGLAFAAAFFAGMWAALFRHPKYGLWTYVAVFYINPPSRWWGETLPDLRWALLSAAVTIVAAVRLPAVPARPGWLATTPGKFLVVFTGWFLIQNLWALDPESHQEASFLFAKYIALYYLIYRLVVTPEDVKKFLLVHFAGCAYFGYLAFTADNSGRLEGVGGPGVDESNAFAMQMDTAVLIGAALILALQGRVRWALLACLPFILNGVILSQSRDGVLALLAGGGVLWALKHRESRARFYFFAVLGVAAMLVLARDASFWQRMGTLEAAARQDESQLDTSALSRLAIINAQLRMARDYPLGSGHRGTAALSPLYLDERFLASAEQGQEKRRASHNTFMTALSEQGIPGAVCYLWMWLWTGFAVWRLARHATKWQDLESRSLVAAVASSMMALFVASLFVDYIKAEIQVWLWALLASMLAWQQARQKVVEATAVAPTRLAN